MSITGTLPFIHIRQKEDNGSAKTMVFKGVEYQHYF